MKRPVDLPLTGIVMGSGSDWPSLQAAARVLEDCKVPCAAIGSKGPFRKAA